LLQTFAHDGVGEIVEEECVRHMRFLSGLAFRALYVCVERVLLKSTRIGGRVRRQLVQLHDATFATGSAMGLRHRAWQSGDQVVGVFVHGHDQANACGVCLANRARCCRPVMSGCIRPSGCPGSMSGLRGGRHLEVGVVRLAEWVVHDDPLLERGVQLGVVAALVGVRGYPPAGPSRATCAVPRSLRRA
jgi:hypothetical protein